MDFEKNNDSTLWRIIVFAYFWFEKKGFELPSSLKRNKPF
jgi:hypothetical protein